MRGESTLNIEYSPDGKKEKKIYIMAIQIYNSNLQYNAVADSTSCIMAVSEEIF